MMDPRMAALQGALGGMPDEGMPPTDSMPVEGEGGDPLGDLIAHAEEVMATLDPEKQAKVSEAVQILRDAGGPGPEADVAPADPAMEMGGEMPPF